MKKLPNSLKTFLEYCPVIIFILAYKLSGDNIFLATKYIIGSSLLSLAIVYCIEKTAPKIMVYSTALIVICGFFTIITEDPKFIKMKPTILYSFLGIFLLISLLRKKIVFKNILGKMIVLSDEDWQIFSYRWVYFFFSLAIINEFIWRNFSDSFWIKFKFFGLPFLLILFIFFNSSLITKNNNKNL